MRSFALIVAVLQSSLVVRRSRNEQVMVEFALRRCWSRWKSVLRVVKQTTLIRWRRAAFRLYRRRELTAPWMGF